MNLKNYHKAQFKAAVYKLMSAPGVLSEYDLIEILQEVVEEVSEGEAN